MKNKILGTSVLKNKYKFAELTKEDKEFLYSNNITVFQCPYLKEGKYLYTSYKAIATSLKNTYSKRQMWELLPSKRVKEGYGSVSPFIVSPFIVSPFIKTDEIIPLLVEKVKLKGGC